ncbi:hypothetical protein DL93DRAFT_763232 [Clavulina sp. PMI_390]|nr:hypothetical protein DL93DRAFT_763232 [Clavulina sp. PMI_390]
MPHMPMTFGLGPIIICRCLCVLQFWLSRDASSAQFAIGLRYPHDASLDSTHSSCLSECGCVVYEVCALLHGSAVRKLHRGNLLQFVT